MNIRKVAGFAFGPVSIAGVSLITVPLTAWYFRAEDIGKISMLQIGVSFCLLFFSLGLDQAYVREYHDRENKQSLFISCALPGLIFLVFTLAGFLIFNTEILSEWIFGTKNIAYSVMLAVCFVAAFVGRFLALILRMQERGWAFSVSQLIPKLTFLAVITMFIAQNEKLGLGQLLAANTIGFIVVVVMFLGNTRKECYCSLQKISLHEQLELLKFGVPLVISGAAFWGMTSLDKVFLRNYSSFEELGLYSVIASFAGVAVVLQNIFTTVWAPTAYKWNSKGVTIAEYQKVVDQVHAVVVMIFAFAGMFSWILKYLLPVEYASGQYIVLACLIYPLLYSLSETTGVGIGIARKSIWSMIAMVVAVIVNLILNYWLVPLHGAGGAAIATGLSFFALFIFRTELSAKFGMEFRRKKLYLSILLCVFLIVCTVLYGQSVTLFINFVWAVMFFNSALYLKLHKIKMSNLKISRQCNARLG